ncbi:flagellar basal body rod protein FlgC [Thalassovita aquimarina]|uniref:Flagellar basal-body rod protein FlgC n=1 Tax=Thalassovita aquimarina TaxID=2785917 RepID=A0ABS5HKZ1_9RHOB|nr:flagellar basal body rod protein FlgC [Thalassovita aquimarina]MBR9649649.1 flagellar basal body rod protein FlgC [Thalassovita aquimarina]
MTMTMNVFDISARAMSAQMMRLNTTASNLANANTVSTNEEDAYRAMRPVFETEYADQMKQSGLATVNVTDVVSLDREVSRSFQPDHPLADPEGYVYEAAVNTDEEMVEMMEASRQYQNTLEAVSTIRNLMAKTMRMGQ